MIENQPLVSIITYCFNGEKFVHRYFEGILSQTYQNIELIFIDNGSTDHTREVAHSFIPKLESRGIQVQFIHFEENQCTCDMKILGINKMHGAYFCGCDSDDVMHPDYIEKMVDYLLQHPDKGMVFCQLDTIQEETGENLGIMKIIPKHEPKAAFLDLLYARNSIFTAISYMMSKSHFQKLYPKNEIYPSLYGENYQIQLPFLYEDLQGYIDLPLGDYYVRNNSYSGKLNSNPQKQVDAYKGQEDSICATLDHIHPEHQERYELIAKKRLRKDRFYASLYLKDKAVRRKCFTELKEAQGVTAKERIIYAVRPLYLLIKR